MGQAIRVLYFSIASLKFVYDIGSLCHLYTSGIGTEKRIDRIANNNFVYPVLISYPVVHTMNPLAKVEYILNKLELIIDRKLKKPIWMNGWMMGWKLRPIDDQPIVYFENDFVCRELPSTYLTTKAPVVRHCSLLAVNSGPVLIKKF